MAEPEPWLRGLWPRANAQVAHLLELGRRVLRRYLPSEAQHLFALTIAVGVVCGFVAVAFHLAIRAAEALMIDRAMNAPGKSWMVWTIVSPTVAGLAAGALLMWLVPGARGSGIPQVKQAFALGRGRIRFRDAMGKFVIAVLQIGSGASLGREGPTAQICAGAASALARVTALPPKAARRLLPVGVAAGIAAAFNAPIAAVTFTIEEIVGKLDQAVLSGVVIAAALAAVIERGVLGVQPVISVKQSYGLDHASSLALYSVLGVFAAVVAVVFSDGLLWLRLWFRRLRVVPAWAHPAIGGLVTGVLAVLALYFLDARGVNGGGYSTLALALEGTLGVKVLAVLCVAKLVATIFSYSSGGCGGIFAPTLFIGAMLGGAVGHLDVWALQHEQQEIGAFALVGMGAVFAGVIRAPMTSVLIIFEMTGGYGLVLPLMLANMTSYALARRWRPLPIYEALLAQDGVELPHEAARAHPLDQLTVTDAMTPEVVFAAITGTAGDVLRAIGARVLTMVPLTRPDGSIAGMVRVASLRALPPETPLGGVVEPAHSIAAGAPLIRAVVRMNDLGVRQLLVVDAERLVGVIAISDLVRAHARAAPRPGPSPEDSLPGLVPELAAATLDVRRLMQPVKILPGTIHIDALVAPLVASPARAVLVDNDGALGVVLLEDLDDFRGDDRLASMLIAADVAHVAPRITIDLPLADVVRQLASSDAGALIVTAGPDVAGIITRATAGIALLSWYSARRAK